MVKNLVILLFPVLVICASVLFPAITGRQSRWFGINQIACNSFPDFVHVLLIAFLFISACILLLRNNYWRIAGAILILVTMFVFRSNTINQDGRDLLWKIPADVELTGAHVVHDEMLELFSHSIFWSALNEFGDIGVDLSYQILSVISGLLFMLLLVKYAEENMGSGKLLFVLLVSSGGFIQLFFGDIENYTITATIVMWYLLVASRVLNGKASTVKAAVILGLAMCFHLEAGFLIPSLAILCLKSPAKEKPLYFLLLMLIPFALVFFCMLLLDASGMLPLENFWLYSHATAHGGNITSILPPLTVPYYLEIINLLILLFPSVLLLPFVIIFARSQLNKIDEFFIIATGFLMLLPLGWKASLGVQNDWNLFALVAIPGSILAWSLWMRISEGKRTLVILALIFSVMNTFSWIWKNHAV